MRSWVLLVMVFLLASSARATTVLRVPLEEMSRSCDLVIQARVQAVITSASPDDERRISTTVRLEILRVLKGHPTGPTLTLTLQGGRTERWTLHIPGMPQFRQGDEVVLFLERTSAGFRPAGLSLGTYRVHRDAVTGKARAVRDLRGLAVIDRTKHGLQYPQAGPVSHADDEMDLDTLIHRVLNALEPAGGAR